MYPQAQGPIRGRGASWNPANRYDHRAYSRDAAVTGDWAADEAGPRPDTLYVDDAARTILSSNDSPDVGFTYSVNPYRGCEHGCIYCYARPTHEFMGLSAGVDFETQIFVKRRAPELLRDALEAKSWVPQVVALSGATDCYQPIERKLQLTRRCLEVFAEFRNPVQVITKNRLVVRDADLLADLAQRNAAAVAVSVTSLNIGLNRMLEPRTSSPQQRLATIRALSDAGVPVCVNVAPVIPAVNDMEIPGIIEAAAESGAVAATYILVRLPHSVAPLFEHWLDEHMPERKEKVLKRIRSLRGGRLNDPNFTSRMRGEGVFAEQIRDLFDVACRRHGLRSRGIQLDASSFRASGSEQLDLF